MGGLLSARYGEVWIYSISVGLGLAEEKQCEWVHSVFIAQGEAREKKSGRRMEPGPKYSIMFKSWCDILKSCFEHLLDCVVGVAFFDLCTLLMH